MDVRILRAERDEVIKKYGELKGKALDLQKRYYRVLDTIAFLLNAIESLAQMSWCGRIKFFVLGSGYLRTEVDIVLKRLGQDLLAKHVARQALQNETIKPKIVVSNNVTGLLKPESAQTLKLK